MSKQKGTHELCLDLLHLQGIFELLPYINLTRSFMRNLGLGRLTETEPVEDMLKLNSGLE